MLNKGKAGDAQRRLSYMVGANLNVDQIN